MWTWVLLLSWLYQTVMAKRTLREDCLWTNNFFLTKDLLSVIGLRTAKDVITQCITVLKMYLQLPSCSGNCEHNQPVRKILQKHSSDSSTSWLGKTKEDTDELDGVPENIWKVLYIMVKYSIVVPYGQYFDVVDPIFYWDLSQAAWQGEPC